MNKKEIKLTISDCEHIWDLWYHKEYEEIEKIVLTLNPLEAMKLAKQLIIYHDEDGCVVNGILNFITEPISRKVMVHNRDNLMTDGEFLEQFSKK